jgi:hypothetical protein
MTKQAFDPDKFDPFDNWHAGCRYLDARALELSSNDIDKINLHIEGVVEHYQVLEIKSHGYRDFRQRYRGGPMQEKTFRTTDRAFKGLAKDDPYVVYHGAYIISYDGELPNFCFDCDHKEECKYEYRSNRLAYCFKCPEIDVCGKYENLCKPDDSVAYCSLEDYPNYIDGEHKEIIQLLMSVNPHYPFKPR